MPQDPRPPLRPPTHSKSNCALEVARGPKTAEIDAQRDKALRYLGTDAAEQNLGAEELDRAGHPHKKAGDFIIDRRHPGNIDDQELRAMLRDSGKDCL